MDDKAIIIFRMTKRNVEKDLEVPLGISANDLVIALNSAYALGIDTQDINNCYLKAEHPTCLLKGTGLLSEFGVRNGTVIYYTE